MTNWLRETIREWLGINAVCRVVESHHVSETAQIKYLAGRIHDLEPKRDAKGRFTR